MTNSQLPKPTIAHQDKGKVEMLSEVAIKQRLRPLVPAAIARLKELMYSRNEAIAMGVAKLVLNKFIPDLKVTELQGNVDKPLGVVILPILKDEPIPTIDLSMGATSRPADSSTTMS